MKKATRVFVTQPKIAEVVVVAPDQLLIHGRAVGATSLVVWFEEKTKAREQWKLRRAGPGSLSVFLSGCCLSDYRSALCGVCVGLKSKNR
jgi:hypothetical protein